MIERVI
jgi:plasmid stabilization system protein ParE